MTSKEPTYLDCNCFAIRQAGVTSAQFTLLGAIHRHPGTTMAGLADALVIERTTLVRALKPLQRDGLVTAQQQDAGSRAVSLELSDAGRKTLHEASLLWMEAQKEFEEKFGRERASDLRKTLLELTSAN